MSARSKIPTTPAKLTKPAKPAKPTLQKTGPEPIRLLFVCLGNICRSPTAEAVMRRLVTDAGLQDHILIDSAGTGDWHVGHPPDKRSQAVGRARGIPLSGQARQVNPQDFAAFDYILAMDQSNLTNLKAFEPASGPKRTQTKDQNKTAHISLLRAFDPTAEPGAEVPDPYYGGDKGFDEVFDICERACRGLLAELQNTQDDKNVKPSTNLSAPEIS